MAQSHDAFATDDYFYYYYNEDRGLTKIKREKSGNWQKIEKVNEACKGWKCVSMILHRGKLLVRHSGIKNQLFIEVDRESLQPVENDAHVYMPEEPVTYNWNEEKEPVSV